MRASPAESGPLEVPYCSIGAWKELVRENPGWVQISVRCNAMPRKPAVPCLPNSIATYVLNLNASVVSAAFLLFRADVLLGMFLTVSTTLVYWHWYRHIASTMSWNVISLAVIFPVSQGIVLSFRRREEALRELGTLLGALTSIWAAAHTWKVPSKASKDRHVLILDNYENAQTAGLAMRDLFDKFLVALVAYLDCARWGRAHHSIRCSGGHLEQQELQAIAHDARLRVASLLTSVRKMTQDFKATGGLAGGETHRLDQYVTIGAVALEKLCALKEYRTPQAFRAFTRVYILLVGSLYGPYYIHLGLGSSGEANNLGLAIAVACTTQLVMAGLFHVMIGLEDVFSRRGGSVGAQVDVVRVPEMVEITRQQLVMIEAEASHGWMLSWQESMSVV